MQDTLDIAGAGYG